MKIFISYRRSDSQDVAGRLYDHLERRLGSQAIFKDTASIAMGSDFAERIRAALQETDAMLVMIGVNWLPASDKAHRRRIDDPTDWIRQEIEIALATNTHIVPVLLGDARLPEEGHLPPCLSRLASFQATRLRPDPDFSGDVERLCQGLGIPSEVAEAAGTGSRSPTLQRPLLVSTVRTDETELELQYTLLFGTPAAAAPTARQIVQKDALAGVMKRVASLPFGRSSQFPQLPSTGDELANILLPTGFSDLLSFEEDTYLLVFHDNAAAEVPWECVRIGNTFPAIAGGLSRRFISPQVRIPPLARPRATGQPNVLVIANPTCDLPGAEQEGSVLARAFQDSAPLAQLTILTGQCATHESVISALAERPFDVVHFAGHVIVDNTNPEKSGLFLADQTVLTAMHIIEAALAPPRLVFVSGASAAQISAASHANNMGLAEAFLRRGVGDLIGPTLPVTDRGCVLFAARFYSSLFRGATVGTALREGRLELWHNSDSDALNWVHYGLPENAPLVQASDV